MDKTFEEKRAEALKKAQELINQEFATDMPEEIVEDATSEELPEEKESQKLVTLNEDFYKQNAMVGLEEIDATDLPTPTLSIVQKNSEQTGEDGNLLPRGVFFYKGDKKAYKEVSCSILAITKREMPDYSDKSILVPTYVLYGVFTETLKPFLLYLKRANIGACKAFLGEVVNSGLPMFAQVVRLVSERVDGDKGTYWVIKFAIEGTHSEPETVMKLAELAKRFAVKKAEVVSNENEVVDEKDLPF